MNPNRTAPIVVVLCVACSGSPSTEQGPPADADFGPIRAVATEHLGPLMGYGRDMNINEAHPNVQRTAAGGDVVHGTDIGIPVTVQGADGTQRVFFFFGDTDPLDPDAWADGKIRKADGDVWDPFVARKGVIQGDALAFADDPDPDDGIQLTHLLRNEEAGGPKVCEVEDADGIRATFVPGLHDNEAFHFVPGVPGDPCIGGATILTPTGAFALGDTLWMVNAVQTSFADPTQPDRSFLSVSTDGGVNWRLLNGGQPLSNSGSGPGGKFIHVSTVDVDGALYRNPATSGRCELPPPPGASSQGKLLYGTGTWLWGGLYLGFVYDDDLRAAIDAPDQPLKIYYWAGPTACWTQDQGQAVEVFEARQGRHYAQWEWPCGHRIVDTTGGLGYTSAIRIRGTADGEDFDRIVLATNPKYFLCPDDGSDDVCCGGQPLDGEPGVCSFPPGEPTRDLRDMSLGIVLLTARTRQPWRFDTTDGDPASPTALSPLPQPASVPFPGAGPACHAIAPPEGYLGGYAPLIVDRYTRPGSREGTFDLYVLSSVWEPDVYNVNAFRTTIEVFADAQTVNRRRSESGPHGAAPQGRRSGGR